MYSTAPADWAIYDLEVTSFLNELDLICLHTCIIIVSTQLNDFNYYYLTLIILFNINDLLAHSEVLLLLTRIINGEVPVV